jgi:hypothetical protein
MTSSPPYVLQFINTSSDVKDYYHLTSTELSYQLRHYLANDDGVFTPECCVDEYGQYAEKVAEALKTHTTDIRFLEDTLRDVNTDGTKSRLKFHIFLGPEFNFEGRYSRFIFHHYNKSRPPTHEANKFVGVLLYAYAEPDTPKNTQQMLMLFKKNYNSIQSYELIGEFDPLVDDLPFSYIEKFLADGNNVDVYFYGERKPLDIDQRLKPLIRTMPLALFVTNREVCDTHTAYQKSCIMCIKADIMSAPRQLAPFKRDNSKNKNAVVRFQRQRRRRY